MPKARVNGVELFYEVSGAGQPVLFIHGGYGGAESAVVAKLPPEITDILPSDRFQVITYDRRNAGQSELSAAHCTLENLADDARALLDHLGVETAIVIGSSTGRPTRRYPSPGARRCMRASPAQSSTRSRAQTTVSSSATAHGERCERGPNGSSRP